MSENAITRTDSAAPAPGRIVALLALAVALIALPFIVKAIGQPALVPLATRVLIYAIAAASLNLALGFGGMVSFGHAAFFGIGGYAVGILYRTFADDAQVYALMSGDNASRSYTVPTRTNRFLPRVFATPALPAPAPVTTVQQMLSALKGGNPNGTP